MDQKDIKREHIYRSLIGLNGIFMQQIVAIEEIGELQKEIIKYIRGEGDPYRMAEEIADVEIMMEQLKLYHCLDEKVNDYKEMKIQRIIKIYPIKMPE